MKSNIHPTYYKDAVITCACGNKVTIGSTVKEIHVELCNKCHPFYTGKKVLLDTQGRVERFKAKASAQNKDSVLSKRAKAEKRAKAKAEKKKLKEESLLIDNA